MTFGEKLKDARQKAGLSQEQLSEKLSKIEKVLEWTVMPTFGIFEAVDQLNDGSSYYLAETDSKQFFVIVSKDFIEYSELSKKVEGKRFEVGSNVFSKAGYTLV